MERVYNNQSDLTLSQRIATYIHDTKFEDISAAASLRAKEIIAYHVSIAFRSLQENLAEAHQAISVAKILSDGGGHASIIGRREKVTMVDAALANTTIMRATGLDDVILPVGIHPALMTLPIAFAVGEHRHSSGAEVIAAVVIAYEIMGKFGTFSWTEDMPRRPTMPYGPFGAVIAAGRLLRLNREQHAHCMGYAAHTAMGLAESDSGQVTHHYGLICRNGLTGAYLAAGGGISSPTVLEGKYGFLEAFCPSVRIDVEHLMRTLGDHYVIIESLEKRYPGTSLNQVPIEAMRNIVKDERFGPDDVVSITLTVPIERKNIEIVQSTGPFPDLRLPPSSAPYQMAMMILDGGELNFARYKNPEDPAIVKLLKKTKVEFVAGKALRYAKVQVETKDGRRHVREGTHFAFPTQDPFAIIERYAAPFLPESQIHEFVDRLDRLEDESDIGKLIALLVPPEGKV